MCTIVQVLAGALQDNRRATIVGETTFGKGLIQTIVELSDGSAVVITAARYRVHAPLQPLVACFSSLLWLHASNSFLGVYVSCAWR